LQRAVGGEMRTVTFFLSVAPLLLLGLSGAAAKTPANLLNAERRTLANDYAKCIAVKYPELVREYVLQAGEGGQPMDRFSKLVDWKCVPRSLSREFTSLYFSHSSARYTFAEYLLKNENTVVLRDYSAVPLLQHPEPMKMEDYKPSGKLSKEGYARVVKNSVAEAAMSRIGECVVRSDTENAQKLLETALESADEMATIQMLLPAAGRCIEDGSIRMKPEHLRGTIALNLYRLTASALSTDGKPNG
jgi:hypothetical protein